MTTGFAKALSDAIQVNYIFMILFSTMTCNDQQFNAQNKVTVSGEITITKQHAETIRKPLETM